MMLYPYNSRSMIFCIVNITYNVSLLIILIINVIKYPNYVINTIEKDINYVINQGILILVFVGFFSLFSSMVSSVASSDIFSATTNLYDMSVYTMSMCSCPLIS